MIHLKNLLPLKNYQIEMNRHNIYKTNSRNRQNSLYQNENESEMNYCNYYLLSDMDKRRLMALLKRIELALGNNDDIYEENEIMNKINNYYIKVNNNKIDGRKLINSKEMEKFFIFICNLSIYQLKILNESQPNPSYIRDDLPIIFNNQFKDCLTNAQRMDLACLESMSLTRYIILKNTNEDICPENLDYKFMKYRIKDTDSDSEKENNKINKIQTKKSRVCTNIETCITQEVNNVNNYKLVNIVSPRVKTKNDLEEEKSVLYDDIEKIMNNIKTKENKDFIDSYKNIIIQVLSEMDKTDQKLFFNSTDMMKKLISKMKKGINKHKKNN